jgi:hypothetical protein
MLYYVETIVDSKSDIQPSQVTSIRPGKCKPTPFPLPSGPNIIYLVNISLRATHLTQLISACFIETPPAHTGAMVRRDRL